MLTDNTARVTLAEGLAVVDQMRELHARCECNGQTLFALVFHLGAEALAESLSNVEDMFGVDPEDGGC